MMCFKILRVSLVVLVGWALSTVSSELGWMSKRSLAQRGRLSQVLSEGERCWLGAKVRRPRVAPEHHLFGVYPSRPGDHLRPYLAGDQGRHHAGRSKLDAEGMAVSSVPPDPTASARVRSAAERPAAPWGGDSPIGQSELLGDDDTYLGDGGSKEPLGEAGAPEGTASAATVITTFPCPKESGPETQRKGWTKTRRRRQVVKGQAGGMRGDPKFAPRHFQPWPKHPLMPRVRTGPPEGGIRNGGGDPAWEAETVSPQERLPVLYFSGRREPLLLRPEVLADIPREAFTVEAWVRPEGGQNSPAIIAGNHPLPGFPWSAGWGWLLVLVRLDIGGQEGKGAEQKNQGGLAGQRGGRASTHLRSRIPDIICINDSITTRAFVPYIDLVCFYTLCWHLGDLQLTLSSLFKGEDLWFFVSGGRGVTLRFS